MAIKISLGKYSLTVPFETFWRQGMDENGYKAQLSIPEVIRLREKMLENGALKTDSAVITTHHSHLSVLLHHDYEKYLTPHGIQVGYDGMVIEA